MTTRQLRLEITETDAGELTALLPPPCMEKSQSVLLEFGLLVWTAGEIAIPWFVFTHPSGEWGAIVFFLFWFVGWTVFGLRTWFAVLWIASGRESISVSAFTLIHRCEVFGIRLTRKFARRDLPALEVMPEPEPSQWDDFGLTRNPRNQPPYPFDDIGPIGFTYQGKTYKFGSGIGLEEAREVVDRLNAKLEQ